MTRPGTDGYLICATPRTGSTLLCGLLTSSGVAGHPASYFNRRGLHDYAETWQIDRPRDGRIDRTYLRAATAAGTTPNGVFAARIMAESLPELISDLAADSPPADSELELLSSRFGRLRFVHLRRGDVVAQAVSWAKALQTHFWHPHEAVRPGGVAPHYDEQLIGRLVTAIEQFEEAWADWFTAQGVVPHRVTYEELSADPVDTAHGVLDHLGLQLPAGRELVVGHRKQADRVNSDWVERFGSHRA
ncbi:Stf0 family sulfotransferase [Microlunatus soli]|uniref:Trehalose 2-sulfotransferase n=1 Tax=Microlunatus soli TaxID=630515 RepID=A0A1H2AHV6_9ACTN|nr:Stf0 family sulfotransferase [Microlunatus soli]SDT45553.1 LPS sulfotransferase NodH [Microlunatus soli]